MKKPSSPRIILLVGVLFCIALTAAMVLLGSALKVKTIHRNQNKQQQESTVQHEGATLSKPPFLLEINETRNGSSSFVSFSVYFVNEVQDELVFTCGRMFASDEVESIAWHGTEYNILVTLRDGSTVLFTFDGNGHWQ